MGGPFHIFNSGEVSLYNFAEEIVRFIDSSTTLTAVDSTFSTVDYIKKGYAPLETSRLTPLRTWKEALHSHLSKLMI